MGLQHALHATVKQWVNRAILGTDSLVDGNVPKVASVLVRVVVNKACLQAHCHIRAEPRVTYGAARRTLIRPGLALDVREGLRESLAVVS